MAIQKVVFLLLLLLLVQFYEVFSTASVSSSAPGLCKKHGLEDYTLIQENQCSLHDIYSVNGRLPSSYSVLEINGTTLERSLQILQTKETMFAAVLVYAKWCPFSRELRPVFEALSSAFPSIYHFSVEESALQPSGFSYYGVHSFPALFLHNKTTKVRYHGSRTLEALSKFYKEFTGLQPLRHNHRVLNEGGMGSSADRLTSKFGEKGGFHEDIYLRLSILFLALRAFFYLLPKLFAVLKDCWNRGGVSRGFHKSLLQRVVLRRFEQEKTSNGSNRRSKGKSPRKELQETGKALLSVPGWSSSPLAAVALAEGSSSRAVTKEDGYM